MTVTQTYYLAHTARGKLSSEASRSDHNLRLLVGHANLLDSLMIELAEAEQEQESWFNNSVKNASPSQSKHIQWADSIVEEPEEDWQAEDADSDSSDSDSEYDDDEDMDMSAPLSRVASHVQEAQEEEYEDDQEEDYESLSLVRSPSHSQSPPELSHDSEDDSSEDEAMPPSPPTNPLPILSEKERIGIVTTSFYSTSQPQKLVGEQQAAFFEDGYYVPQRSTPGLVSAISVYWRQI